MTIIKITELPAATSPVSPSDVLPVVQSGTTKKAGINQLGYKLPGTTTVTRTIAEKLEETVNVKDFGAVGDGVADDTTAIQNAFDHLKANGGTIVFDPGTYKVTQVTLSQMGENKYRNFCIIGNGATLQGTTSAAPFRIYRCQGLVVDGLRMVRHASATYSSVLDNFWFADFKNCMFGHTRLYSEDGWGVYWNAFYDCDFASLYFDVSTYSINQNTFYTCKVGPITKANVSHPTFKEAYNNVFIGCDMVGQITWTDPNPEFRDPLVLRDSNMEYTGINTGYIIAEGGRSNPADAANTRFFTWDDLRSEYNQQYSGSSWATGWRPWSDVNLFRGGAAQKFSPSIGNVGVNNPVTIISDATSPSGNGLCYNLSYSGGAANPAIALYLPLEYLPQAKQVGYVSFCFDVKTGAGGASIVANTSGTSPSGDAYPSGLPGITSSWQKIFVQVPVTASSTQVVLWIGTNTVTSYNISITNIGIYLGKIARPCTPASGDPFPKRGRVFNKTLVANGSAQNTFTLTIPATNRVGRAVIKASSVGADSVSIYEGELFYARFNSGSQITANIVQRGKAETSYGGSATGTISAMAASASGSTVTVTTTITAFAGSPNRTVTYEVEFLDYDETLTVL